VLYVLDETKPSACTSATHRTALLATLFKLRD